MKIKNLLAVCMLAISLFGFAGCGSTAKENIVKIKSIRADSLVGSRMRKAKEAKEIDDYNYVIISKGETDFKFTITLDNPEAFGIDALRIVCDDPNAQIQIEGEWKPIAQEDNGTRVVNWSSEDPYEKTYNVRTTSTENLLSFKVIDIRLAGHDTFLSKESNSDDFGNNKLDIYKIDSDAFEINYIKDTLKEVQFKIDIKEGVTNLSNFKVDGQDADSEGIWTISKVVGKEFGALTYDFELNNGIKVTRKEESVYLGIALPKAWKDGETEFKTRDCSVTLVPDTSLEINSKSLIEYMNYDDVEYIDLRDDSEGYKLGHIKGFKSVSYFHQIVGEEEQLFRLENNVFIPNYEDSEERLLQYFPKDTIIFLMCQTGGRVINMIKLLKQLGYDVSMIYNVGGWNHVRTANNYAGYDVVLG